MRAKFSSSDEVATKAVTEIVTSLLFAICFLRAFFNRWQHHFFQIARRMEWMHMESVADFPGEFCQAGIHTCDIDWNTPTQPSPIFFENGGGQRRGFEKRRHQRQLVILAAKIQLCSILPRVPQGADGKDLLA